MKTNPTAAVREKNIALLIETSNRHGRDMVSGVHAFAREHPDWVIHMAERGRNEGIRNRFPRNLLDGILLRVEQKEALQLVQRLRIPAVTVGSVGKTEERITIAPNCHSMTRLAMEHLLERRLFHFGFFGDIWFEWSVNRGNSFAEQLRQQGFDCHIFQCRLHGRKSWNSEYQAITRWVLQLPKPIGVMACDDMRARQLLDVCRNLGVSIPDEVAVIGVDNDELFCEMCEPTLSSIVLDGQKIGYEAASLLNQLMNGIPVPLGLRRIPAMGVVTRQSTEGLAVRDGSVAAALQFIRQHAVEKITVNDVAQAAQTSRRTLERRCRQLLDSTIVEQIQKVRISLVQRLLVTTDLSLKTIALRTGFEHPEYLSVAFKRQTGLNPSDYRKERGTLPTQREKI